MSLGEDAVIQLSEKAEFDAFLASKEFVLAEFYAPWCGHCKQLKEPYEQAAKSLAEDEELKDKVSLVAVDATVAKELAEEYGVQGFPTLKWITNKGQNKGEYGGGRDKDGIVNWIKKKTGPPCKDITDEATLKAEKEANDVFVFGYFSDLTSADAKAYEEVAQGMDDVPFGISNAFSNGLTDGTVVVYRNFEGEEPAVTCEGDVKKCVSGNMLPLIIPFSQESAPKIFGGAIKQHVLIFLDTNTHTDVVAKSKTAAVAKKGEYLFVSVDKTEDKIHDYFGIKDADLPTARVVVMDEGGMQKYKLAEDFGEDSLLSFVNAHGNGELSEDLKSEDAPEQQGNVYVLVGTTHDEIAGGDKNVLVEYYAPWCGHCKKLAPEYEKLGEHYKDDDNIIIAKMDSTANEVSSVKVSGFPTIKFFEAGSSTPKDFDGSRDFEGMKAFIEKERK